MQCRYCGRDISPLAPICPHCGHPNPGEAPFPAGCILSPVLLVIAFIGSIVINSIFDLGWSELTLSTIATTFATSISLWCITIPPICRKLSNGKVLVSLCYMIITGALIYFLCYKVFKFLHFSESSPDSENNTEVVVDSVNNGQSTYQQQEEIEREDVASIRDWYDHHHHHFVGEFINYEGRSPVEIDFDRYDGNISDVIYKNVTYGGKIRMTCTDNSDTHIMLTGKDGRNTFTIELYQKSNGNFEGEAIDGKKQIQVVLTPQCESEEEEVSIGEDVDNSADVDSVI